MSRDERRPRDGRPTPPPDLTDMHDPDYRIENVKDDYRRDRKKYVGKLRYEGKFDEDGEAMEKSFDWQLMRRLLAFVAPYRLQLGAGVVLLLGYSAISPIFPSLIGQAVDRFLIAGQEPWASLNNDQRLDGLLLIVAIYMGLRLVNFGLRYGYTYLVAWMGQHVVYDIRKAIFGKIQRLHMGFFDRTPVGRLITRITSDVDAIQMLVTDGLVGLVADVGILVGLMVYMFTIDWRLALITLTVMPLLFGGLTFLRFRLRDAYRSVRLRTSRSNAYLAENLGGIKTVQLFNRETRNQKAFDHLNLQLLDAHAEQVRWFSLFWPLVNVASAVSTALILWYAAYHLVGPGVSEAITIGVLITFQQYAQMFFRPLQDLSDKFNIIQAAMASSERIFGLLDTPERIVNKPAPDRFETAFRGEVAFDNVWFAYDEDDWVLRDVSFTIKPGESVAFVGHTGAGKTTIISLVSRFYDVQRGAGEDRRQERARLRPGRAAPARRHRPCRIRSCSAAPSAATSPWATTRSRWSG